MSSLIVVMLIILRLSFGTTLREGPFNVDTQECFFYTQEMNERVLLDWAVKMGVKDGR